MMEYQPDPERYRSYVRVALGEIEHALAMAETMLPVELQRQLWLRKKQKVLNPWSTLRWEYEARPDADPAIAHLLVDIVNLSTAFCSFNILLYDDPHADIPVEQLDLRVAKTRRVQ